MSALVSPRLESSQTPDNVKDPTLVTSEFIPDVGDPTRSSPRTSEEPVIYTVKDLVDNPALLREIVSLINSVYVAPEEEFEPELRFEKDQDLVDQFGKELICAVIRSEGHMLATASITPWHEYKDTDADVSFKKMRPDDYHLVESGESYEIRAVSVADTPASRKKGLATICIKALQEAVFARNGGTDFLVWVHTKEKVNGAYWRRRGFQNILIEWKPVGFWGALREFRYATLVKKIHCPKSE